MTRQEIEQIEEVFGGGEEDTTAEPEVRFEEMVRFPAHCKGYRSSDTNGELSITVNVPLEAKYDALKWTDLVGEMMMVVVHRRVWERRDNGGD